MTTFVWLCRIVFLAFLLFVGWRVVRKLRVLRAQLAAYRRGDYREQLKIVEGFRTKKSEPPHYLFFHGSACFQLGRLEEAERALRRSLSMETNAALRTLCRDELGLLLMEQGRWDEAAACFRTCMVEAPNRGGGHRAMAELLLRHGEQYAAALHEARAAVAADRSKKAGHGKLAKEDYAYNLSESLAFLAWALARNSADPDEVKSALNEAFALCGETAKPILARLHFCAGNACAVLGNTAESSRHFERATEVDPHGNYGRLARAAVAAVNPSA
ncbi:MAG TPA: hypothetical protein VGF03_17575 [Bryobacteraceae bacterium]